MQIVVDMLQLANRAYLVPNSRDVYVHECLVFAKELRNFLHAYISQQLRRRNNFTSYYGLPYRSRIWDVSVLKNMLMIYFRE
jgi:hypothetical protein